MANTACTETAAIRLDGSLAEGTTIRFADEEVNAAPQKPSSFIICESSCAAATIIANFCAAACIVSA